MRFMMLIHYDEAALATAPQKEFAGYFFVEAPSLDEAIVWATRCPSSKYGSIEIRPVVDPTTGVKG